METLCFAVGIVIGLLLKKDRPKRNERREDGNEAAAAWAKKMSQQFAALQEYNGMAQEDIDD